ncbi:hypothetical protein Scep_026565 [Stephania cephalantha]|uniref:Uncharacterized protein n=1 Tax=Stephania cephalantha TaxID=152367 RepID=A0AAP0EKF1_9MAGN
MAKGERDGGERAPARHSGKSGQASSRDGNWIDAGEQRVGCSGVAPARSRMSRSAVAARPASAWQAAATPVAAWSWWRRRRWRGMDDEAAAASRPGMAIARQQRMASRQQCNVA